MSESSSRASKPEVDTSSRKIFVGGLGYNTDDAELNRHFSSFGLVEEAIVMKDSLTRRSRGFGFIIFKDASSVDRAIAKDHIIDSRKVEIKQAVPKSDSTSSTAPSSTPKPPIASITISAVSNPVKPSSTSKPTTTVASSKVVAAASSTTAASITTTTTKATVTTATAPSTAVVAATSAPVASTLAAKTVTKPSVAPAAATTKPVKNASKPVRPATGSTSPPTTASSTSTPLSATASVVTADHKVDLKAKQVSAKIASGSVVGKPIGKSSTISSSGVNSNNNSNSNNVSSKGSSSGIHGYDEGSSHRFSTEEFSMRKIFVGGLHYETRDDDFKKYFEKFGKVMFSEVMLNRETFKSRGFGFIIYEKEDSVDKVCDEAEHSIHGKAIEVKRAIPRAKIEEEVCYYYFFLLVPYSCAYCGLYCCYYCYYIILVLYLLKCIILIVISLILLTCFQANKDSKSSSSSSNAPDGDTVDGPTSKPSSASSPKLVVPATTVTPAFSYANILRKSSAITTDETTDSAQNASNSGQNNDLNNNSDSNNNENNNSNDNNNSNNNKNNSNIRLDAPSLNVEPKSKMFEPADKPIIAPTESLNIDNRKDSISNSSTHESQVGSSPGSTVNSNFNAAYEGDAASSSSSLYRANNSSYGYPQVDFSHFSTSLEQYSNSNNSVDDDSLSYSTIMNPSVSGSIFSLSHWSNKDDELSSNGLGRIAALDQLSDDGSSIYSDSTSR
jgi:RNA recognition motif-containing protein